MGTVYISIGELIRISERQIDVGLCGEMEDGVDIVLFDAALDVFGVGDVAVVEFKIWFVIEHARVVEGGAVVELVKGDNLVGFRIGDR